MIEYIGKVKLNYEYYAGSDLYSDGDAVEEEMLNIAKNGNWEEELLKSDKWAVLYHFSDIRGNLVDWYPMEKTASVLEIGAGCGAISGFLCKKAQKVVGIELSKRRSMINAYRNKNCDNLEIMVGNFKDMIIRQKFDYVTLIGVLEYAGLYMDSENPYEDMLLKIREYLKPGGKIMIAIENKMGLKYLNGAKEDHVGKAFVGMEDYRYRSMVRTFSKPELIKMLENCGIGSYSFYYPVPDYKLPDTIYSDECLPQKGDVRLWGTNYDMPRIALYNDAIMADQICEDRVFDYFSNSFFLVANEQGNKVKYAHYTRQRDKAYQTFTMVYACEEDRYVEKEYLFPEEKRCDILANMKKYYPALQEEFENLSYLSPKEGEKAHSIRYKYLEGNTIESLLLKDIHHPSKLLEHLEKAFDWCFAIKKDKIIPFQVSSQYQEIFGNCTLEDGAASVKPANLDMNFGNLMLCKDRIYCFDYEWVFDFPIPVDFMKFRCLNVFHSKFNMYYAARLKKEDIMKGIGLKEKDFEMLKKMDLKYQEFVYGEKHASQYLQHYRKPCGVMEYRGI